MQASSLNPTDGADIITTESIVRDGRGSRLEYAEISGKNNGIIHVRAKFELDQKLKHGGKI